MMDAAVERQIERRIDEIKSRQDWLTTKMGYIQNEDEFTQVAKEHDDLRIELKALEWVLSLG